MSTSICRRALALLAVTAFLTTGCASTRPVPLDHTAGRIERPAVNVGESVVVKTRSGQTRKFTVTAVEDEALVGKDVRVAYADMSALAVERAGTHSLKPIAIVGIVLGVAAVAAAVSGGGSGGGSGY